MNVVGKIKKQILGNAKAIILAAFPEFLFLSLFISFLFLSLFIPHMLGVTDTCFHLGVLFTSDLLIMSRIQIYIIRTADNRSLLYKSWLCSIVMEQMPACYKTQSFQSKALKSPGLLFNLGFVAHDLTSGNCRTLRMERLITAMMTHGIRGPSFTTVSSALLAPVG